MHKKQKTMLTRRLVREYLIFQGVISNIGRKQTNNYLKNQERAKGKLLHQQLKLNFVKMQLRLLLITWSQP